MKSVGRRMTLVRRLLVLALGCLGAPALAQNIEVLNLNDSGPGSLRQAMLDAAATPDDSVITFAPTANGEILLASPLPDLLDSGGALTIAGNGADTTVIDGADMFRPFSGNGINLIFELRNLTVRNGRAPGSEHGGAVRFIGATLAIDAVEFHGNSTAPGGGGALFATATTVRIEDSAFHDNSAAGLGSAIQIDSGGDVDIVNSTFLGDGGASSRIISITGNIRTQLMNTTVDAAGSSFGIFQSGADMALANCLLTGAGNTDFWVGSQGTFDNAGSRGNVIGVASVNVAGGASWHISNRLGVSDALLGPLGNYGGPTSTMPLLPGSPAINWGVFVGANGSNLPSPLNDQRGLARVGNLDAGAFESQGFSISTAAGDSQSAIVGTAFAAALVAEVVADNPVEPVEGAQVDFRAPTSGASATLSSATATVGPDGRAQVDATANMTVGGPYVVIALVANRNQLPSPINTPFLLTNTADPCAAFVFPYTLAGADNTARVAELRQAIECANANATADVIDLGGQVLSLIDGPYVYASTYSALPSVSSALTLRNGELQRDAAASGLFRLVHVASNHLTVEAMTFRGARGAGGALRSDGALTVLDSTFIDNQSRTSSDMYDGGAIKATGLLTIRGSWFQGNQGRDGGAIQSRTADIRETRFIENQATTGGAVSAWGDTAIAGSQFLRNSAGMAGALAFSAQVDVINTRFEGNTATIGGAAIAETDHSTGARVVNSLFLDNTVAGDGGIVMWSQGTAEFTHITASGNSTGSGGAFFSSIFGESPPPVVVRNSILWGNNGVPVGLATIERSIVEGGFAGGTDILDRDPRFVDAANGDYTLGFGSPAIDAGDNAFVAPDTFDVDEDTNLAEDAPDLAGNPRRYDDVGVVDTGAGTAPIVDMGAFEKQTNSPVTVPMLSIDDVTVSEGDVAVFTVSLTPPAPAGGVIVQFTTVNFTALAGLDYVAQSSSIDFLPGEWAKTITVQTLQDLEVESSETFSVILTNAVNATIADEQGVATILDNDVDPCAAFPFAAPAHSYTLVGADNAARVAELRQAIDCANANATDDAIDLAGNTLVFSDAPYSNANGDTALPFITSTIELRNGELERDAAAPPFRLLYADAAGVLTVLSMHLRGGAASDEGGAILALGALLLRDSVFENNVAATRGGAVSAPSGAAPGYVYALTSRFTGNTAVEGAAIAGRNILAVNAQFHGNGDGSSQSVLWGDAYLALVGSVVADNHPSAAGSSLIHLTGNVSAAEMRHVTIADNSVQDTLLRYAAVGAVIQVRNSIVWDNQFGSLGNVSPVHSILPGFPPVNGNLDADPGFIATPNNYRLAAGSPAIDAGDNAYSFPDAYDFDEDGNTTELMPDLDLNPRPWDDPDVVDTGLGTAPLVDIGAYERQPASALPELSVNDVTVTEGHSGTVDADFTITLSAPAPLGGVAFDITTFNGTASGADNDYVAQSFTSMFIAAGQTSTTFTVLVNGDTTFEPNETFFVNATNAVNAVIVDDQGMATILNDDADPCIAFPFAAPTHTYTLAGSDNTARVAELRQAVECANANATDDTIELDGHVLTFTDAAYGPPYHFTALPPIAGRLTLRNGELQRPATGAPQLRFLETDSVNSSLTVDAITFRNGFAPYGGAIFSQGKLEVLGSTFLDNRSGSLTELLDGGAIIVSGGNGTFWIRDSHFRGNSGRNGGGIWLRYASYMFTIIRNSTFVENTAEVSGGAVGTGVETTMHVVSSQFHENSASCGGAMSYLSNLAVLNSRFVDNQSQRGGALCQSDASETGNLYVQHSLFAGNVATDGAVFAHLDGGAVFYNITATGNTAPGSGTLFQSDPAQEAMFRNSILWGNAIGSVGAVQIERGLVQGGFPGGSAILDRDPRFVDPANDDYTPDSGSPAVDAGDNAFVLGDFYDIDEDGDPTGDPPDLAGNPRRHDDANVVDTGLGTAPLVDLGAFERQTDSAPAGITVTPTGGLVTTEAGVTATFTVVLEREPLADVTIPLSSDDTSEGTVSHADLTFTTTNWNVAQTVTVTGVDDALADGDIAYTIATGAAVSTDPNYNGVDAPDVSVTNTDNDSAGITVAPTGGLTTTEAGGSATFTVVLDSQPTANVTLPLSSSDTTEGTVPPASLTFTAANWNVAQSVAVTGADDSEVDGDVAYTIVTGAATSTDANYNGADAPDVSVTNTDNDSAGITVAPTGGLTTSEAGSTATFTIALNSQPSADVVVGLSSSDATEGSVAPTSLTFSSTNWNAARTVTVTGVDDSDVDGDIAYSIVTAAATSTDANYSGMVAADVAATNTDDDVAGANVMAYKSVAQVGTVQQPAIYDIQLVNLGGGDQPDDPAGDELVDVLPSELALRTATADGGTITLDVPGNTIRWNGTLAAGASPVTIRIEADVVITQRTTIYNQATLAYDTDGDGNNDTPGLSTDPSQPGTDVPTAFEFAGGAIASPIEPIRVPVDNRLGQLFLLLTMLGAALVAMRRGRAGL